MVLHNDIDKSISKGIEFLCSKQGRDGLWRDFETLAGKSSEWVSAFVLNVILLNNTHDIDYFKTLDNLTLRQRPNGGWSYNKIVPTDCDSTAWVLLLLSKYAKNNSETIKKGIHYMYLHYKESSGGFSTYNQEDDISTFIQSSDNDLTGWFDTHSDVTSLVIQSLISNGISLENEILRTSIDYLKQQQDSITGLWKSYWWTGCAYGTFHALKSLSMSSSISEKEILKPILSITSDQKKHGGWNNTLNLEGRVFDTSFNILSLLLYPTEQTIICSKKAISWIVDKQNSDGSWPSNPMLRIPHPMSSHPNTSNNWQQNKLGSNVVIEDKNHIFTSAAALWALMEYNHKYNPN